jgi:putative ABC transport system substrate-binding protein
MSAPAQAQVSAPSRRWLLVAMVAALLGTDVHAQPAGKPWRIGMLETTSRAENAANLDAFRAGMREFGYLEGQHFILEYRSADGRAERFDDLATELLRLKVDLIVTRGTPAVIAARKATHSVPIVMAAAGDPVLSGIIGSLSHPGGNVTGLSSITVDVSGKRLELLRDALGKLSRVAVLVNLTNPNNTHQWTEIEAAARAMGIECQVLDVRRVEDFARSIETAVGRRADALVVVIDALTQANRGPIVQLAAKHRLPAIYMAREFVEAGGFMAYGVNYADLYRRAAGYVAKILKGARAGDLPVEQPTNFDLLINLKTAKALGLSLPRSLLLRADQVIE